MSLKAISLAWLAVVTAAALPLRASAHGTLELPASRALTCHAESADQPRSAACQAAREAGGIQQVHDWNGVRIGNAAGNHRNLVPDGKLCSAGSANFRGLDLARADWPRTFIAPTSDRAYTFVWRASTRHATQYFKYYITREGWRPDKPLRWRDLEAFATVPGSAVNETGGRYRMTVQLPQRRAGNHLIFSVWQRSDSPEAFYACADVAFPHDGLPVSPASWEDQGSVGAVGKLAVGTRLTFRVMDTDARDVAKHVLEITAANAEADAWSYELARKVNAESHFFRIGELQANGAVASVVPQASASRNRVYVSKHNVGYHFEIDKETELPDVANVWLEGKTYEIDHVVMYRGQQYRCLQRHTAWRGAGWNPVAAPALWHIVR